MSGRTINILVWLNTLIKCLQFAESCQNWVSSPTFKWLIGWDVCSLYKFWYFLFFLGTTALDTYIRYCCLRIKLTNTDWVKWVPATIISLWKYLDRYLVSRFVFLWWILGCTLHKYCFHAKWAGIEFYKLSKIFRTCQSPKCVVVCIGPGGNIKWLARGTFSS